MEEAKIRVARYAAAPPKRVAERIASKTPMPTALIKLGSRALKLFKPNVK